VRAWPHALAALLAVPAVAVAAPVPQAGGTPVMGESRLTPEQMAAWFGSLGVTPRIPIPVVNLARLFVQEGDLQGVRGDLAFAQSMLETGNLRYGGIVTPADNNYSGLGACDRCSDGNRFPSARLGVRAQIQHLWAYGDPAARVEGLARPLADIRFALVQPPGKAPTWEQMGAGNWATDRDYARKVLGVYARMLAHAGLAPEGGPVGAAAGPLPILVSRTGAVRLGPVRAASRPLADAVATLGSPGERLRTAAGCLVRWPALGAAIGYAASAGADPCADDAGRARAAVLSGSRWRTGRGLAVGDPEARVGELYPRARRRGGVVELFAAPRARVRLSARLSDGRVAALVVAVPPAAA
jgi:hypothetical protein